MRHAFCGRLHPGTSAPTIGGLRTTRCRYHSFHDEPQVEARTGSRSSAGLSPAVQWRVLPDSAERARHRGRAALAPDGGRQTSALGHDATRVRSELHGHGRRPLGDQPGGVLVGPKDWLERRHERKRGQRLWSGRLRHGVGRHDGHGVGRQRRRGSRWRHELGGKRRFHGRCGHDRGRGHGRCGHDAGDEFILDVQTHIVHGARGAVGCRPSGRTSTRLHHANLRAERHRRCRSFGSAGSPRTRGAERRRPRSDRRAHQSAWRAHACSFTPMPSPNAAPPSSTT